MSWDLIELLAGVLPFLVIIIKAVDVCRRTKEDERDRKSPDRRKGGDRR